MYDYGLSTLSQYDINPAGTRRTRGALLCQSQEGLFILKEFHGSLKKLKLQYELQKELDKNTDCFIDVVVPTQEGELTAEDKDGILYILRRWCDGRECDTRSWEDIQRSVEALAHIHRSMHLPAEEFYQARPQAEEYARHNRELRTIQKFIRKKGASHPFEKLYLSSCQEFICQGEEALERLEFSEYRSLLAKERKEGCVCHGEYSQHNVLLLKEQTGVTNFEHWTFDIQISDLYRFMRKILEKYDWDVNLAEKMLKAYDRVKPISRQEWENLQIRFRYPEKFWKLANYYYTHNKVWIPEKNTEKLEKLIAQKDAWSRFSRTCFGAV